MAKVDCSELAKVLTQLAMNLATDKGVVTIDDVVVKMQEHFPDIRRESLVDAIVEVTTGQVRQADDLGTKLLRIRQEARTDKRLQKKVSQLQSYLGAGQVPESQAKQKAPAPDAIAQLKSIVADLKKQVGQSEPAQKERITKSIADLEEKIRTGNIYPNVKTKKPAQSKELETLEYNRDQLRRQIRRQINSLKPKRVWEHIAEPFNAARALITSLDLSAMLRQGGFIVIGHPARGMKVFGPMIRAAASEKTAARIEKEILNRPNAPLYARSKLFIAPLGGDTSLSKMEEAYMSKWAEKIPLVRASERAYVTFLNMLRADSFDTMAAGLAKNGTPTQEEINAIANFINVSTGRGSLGAMERAAVGLNTIFFAPRYSVSRFQMLALQPLYGGTAQTRKMIAGEYARYLIGMGIVYALAMLAGFDVEEDPRSSDFGKLRVGNTRLDPLSGFSQSIVVTSRVASGKTKSGMSGIKPIRGKDVPYGGRSTYDVMATFMRAKLSPMFGTAINVATGENVVGEAVTPATVARDLTVPLAVRDVHEAIVDQGLPKGTAMGLVALMGVGLQTYGQAYDSMSKTKLMEVLNKSTYKADRGKSIRERRPHKGKEQRVALIKTELQARK